MKTLCMLWAAIVSMILLDAAAYAAAPQDCASLSKLKAEDVNLLSATVVPASGDLPEYCRVLGYVRPAINFEIRMPTAGWNRKFYMAGCGGFCGRLDSDRPGFTNAMNYGLRRSYAVSTMDSGHWGNALFDGRWAYNNRVAEVDWAYRAVSETARVTKTMIKAFYGSAQDKSYFAGCSTGGRMANMEAWKFPDDFDGIISGAPALDYTGLVATFFAWVTQANTGADGKEILSRAKVKLIQNAVYESCDAKDGLKDGLIADPRACDFKPASLQCKGAAGEDCLTAAEVGVLEKWYAGAKNSKGEQLYPGGIPPGSEPYWPLWLTGNPANSAPSLIPLFGQEFLRYMAFADDPGEHYTIRQFDFDKDPPRLAAMAEIYNSTDPDLTKFKQRGGKLIMYHGWADAIVPPYLTIQYLAEVEKRMGGHVSTQDFLRLFMVPGFDHCGIQSEPGVTETGIDPLTALEDWVEKGKPPESLLMIKKDADGKIQWTRPVCSYPQVAKYTGGDVKDAASFACGEP
jgi:tannase/feruloyl esterase